ncbi:hypothetical protein [Brucella anthropi]|uniref:hypothetical protein n=1 Tax=Brucella anthropi TaxID=529 RepID=UPI00384FDE30
MTTLPEEAVKAAAQCYLDRTVSINETASSLARAMLTAALPFLSVQGAVTALKWHQEDNGDFIAESVVGWYHIGLPHRMWNLTKPTGEVLSFWTLDETKAAAQADFEARILSALEPSAARELALEEHLHAIEQQLAVNLGYFHDEKRFLLETLQAHITTRIAAIRVLSSPDHADAGKVEGNGTERTEFNRGYVLACANIVNLHGADVAVMEGFAQLGISKAELKALDLCDYDQRAIDALEDYFGAEKLYRTSAPASEGAE